jgi:transcription elongation GreA/GreB family factor
MKHVSYVLQDEYDHLLEKKVALEKSYKEQSKRKREACEQWAETWHDNADYEDAEYQQNILSKRIHDLQTIINNSKIIAIQNLWENTNTIRIWSRVEILIDKKEFSYAIWWHPTLPWRISYMSPLWKCLLDKKIGSTIEFIHENNVKVIHILSIS